MFGNYTEAKALCVYLYVYLEGLDIAKEGKVDFLFTKIEV